MVPPRSSGAKKGTAPGFSRGPRPREDELIKTAFEEHPGNNNRFLVSVKLRLINRFCSTNIIAENRLAHNIADRNIDLAPLLDRGEPEAIRVIAECGIGRIEQVFASKSAHFHQPDAFPLGDKYVDAALRALELHPWSHFNHRNGERLHDLAPAESRQRGHQTATSTC
jgi:hypothetical protein